MSAHIFSGLFSYNYLMEFTAKWGDRVLHYVEDYVDIFYLFVAPSPKYLLLQAQL